MVGVLAWEVCLRGKRASMVYVGGRLECIAWTGLGDVVVLMACWRRCPEWRANVGGVLLLLLLLLLLKCYPEEQNDECLLLKQKRKNVPNRSGQ